MSKFVKDLLNLDEVCEYLEISRNTLNKFINEDDLPVIDLGERNLRVKFEHLQTWLDSRTVTKGVKCVGCDNRIVDTNKDFRDEMSRKEFGISGLCQKCQDGVFEKGAMR